MDMGVQGVSLMVDFETLGVSRDCVVLSGAAICFRGGRALFKRYAEFEVLEQIAVGATVDSATVAWWNRENEEEFTRLLHTEESPFSIELFVNELMEDLKAVGKLKEFWSRGHMDFEIFNYHLKTPLEYYVFRDIRTLDSLGFPKMKKNSHNALEDCENQLEYLLEIQRKCQELNTEQLKDLEDLSVSPGVGIPLVFPSRSAVNIHM